LRDTWHTFSTPQNPIFLDVRPPTLGCLSRFSMLLARLKQRKILDVPLGMRRHHTRHEDVESDDHKKHSFLIVVGLAKSSHILFMKGNGETKNNHGNLH